MIAPYRKDVRLHGKSPIINQVTTSYPLQICDAIIARLQLIPFFSGFTFRNVIALQVQPEHIPYCGVYFIQEFMTADGDPNAGEVRFRVTLNMGISVIIQNNDAVAANITLDKASQHIMNTLFRDRTLYDGDYPDDAKIQSFANAKRSHVFGASPAKDNELPMAELRIEMTADLGTVMYEPQITDNLETIHETTYPPGYDSQTTPIETVIDVDHEGR